MSEKFEAINIGIGISGEAIADIDLADIAEAPSITGV